MRAILSEMHYSLQQSVTSGVHCM